MAAARFLVPLKATRLAAWPEPSADLLRKRRATGLKPGDAGVDVIDCKCNTADT